MIFENNSTLYFFLGIILLSYILLWYAVIYLYINNKKLCASHKILKAVFNALSHDLANSIQTVSTASSILIKNPIYNSDKLNIIIKNTQKISRVFKSLNNVAKCSTEGKLQLNCRWHNSKEILNEIKLEVEELALQKNIQIDLSFINIDDRCKIYVDKEIFIFEALRNFITNSIKFSESGNKILISASLDKIENKIIISIRDFGVGIEQNKLKKIFSWHEATTTLGTQGESGSGLGLPIAYLFLKSMMIDVNIDSWTKNELNARTCGSLVTLKLNYRI